MKLIVTGASGFVGTEVVRQSLSNPAITSVVALTRRPISVPANLPPNSDETKLNNILIKDYGDYSDPQVRDAITGADACIWTVAIALAFVKDHPWEQVRKVCQEDAVAGLAALYTASAASNGGAKPFRFIYMSGWATERNQDEKLWYLNDYRKLRVRIVISSSLRGVVRAESQSLGQGQAENELLAYAATPERKGRLEVAVVKPGGILPPGEYVKRAMAYLLLYTMGLPKIEVSQCAVAMLRECVEGLSKETVENDDLVRIAEGVAEDAVGTK